MLAPLLASAAFGFLKGYLRLGEPRGFNVEMDMIGPAKEEFLYRGAPLWLFPKLPYGATAVTFAVDHVISDHRQNPMTWQEAAARFGDVLLGGMLYEAAFRRSGLLGAIAAHGFHNIACGAGSKMRPAEALP